MKKFLVIFSLIVSGCSFLRKDQAKYSLYPKTTMDYSILKSSVNILLPVRSCHKTALDSISIKFVNLKSLRFRKYESLCDSEFLYNVLEKIYNGTCLTDTSFFCDWNLKLSKSEYEKYNNPDLILKKYFTKGSYFDTDSNFSNNGTYHMPEKFLRERWYYGELNYNYKLSREILICFLVLFDNHYQVNYSASMEGVFDIVKIYSDKEILSPNFKNQNWSR